MLSVAVLGCLVVGLLYLIYRLYWPADRIAFKHPPPRIFVFIFVSFVIYFVLFYLLYYIGSCTSQALTVGSMEIRTFYLLHPSMTPKQ